MDVISELKRKLRKKYDRMSDKEVERRWKLHCEKNVE